MHDFRMDRIFLPLIKRKPQANGCSDPIDFFHHTVLIKGV